MNVLISGARVVDAIVTATGRGASRATRPIGSRTTDV
jgi:hypothetical protein